MNRITRRIAAPKSGAGDQHQTQRAARLGRDAAGEVQAQVVVARDSRPDDRGRHPQPGKEEPAPNDGAVLLFHGGPAGLGPSPAVVNTAGIAASCQGCAVAGDGDANSDGPPDVVVGALADNNPEQDEGAVLLYLGRRRAPSASTRDASRVRS